MATKEMTLKTWILAQGDQAIKEFHKAEQAVQGFSDKLSAFRKYGGEAFSIVGKGVNFLLAPLKFAASALAGIGTAVAGFTAKALHAASADEELVNRLAALYNSADKAGRVFKYLEGVARISPFKTEDLAEATITLEQFGLASRRNLESLAGAARLSGENIATLAFQVGALQARGLKRMGIVVDEKDGQYTIAYTNNLRQKIKLVAKDADDARKKLFEVMAMKSPGGFQPRGLGEFVSMLKNNIDQVFANFGEPMLKGATQFIQFLAQKLNALIESGKLQEWGATVGEWIGKAESVVTAIITEAPKMWDALVNLFKEGPGKFTKLIMDAFAAGIDIFIYGFIRAIGAGAAMWAGIGKILGAAIMEKFLLLPGMELTRLEMANKTAESMGPEALKAWMDENKVTSTTKMTPEQEASLASANKGQIMMEGMKQTLSALPNLMKDIGGYAAGKVKGLGKEMEQMTGENPVTGFNTAYDKAEAERKAPRLVTERKQEWHRGADNTKLGYWAPSDFTYSATGTEQKGMAGKYGGVIVNIASAVFQASSADQAKRSLMEAGMRPAMATAGT